jgi:uncharacterized protein
VILPDVNVLVYAHDRAAPRHDAYRAWLQDTLEREAALGLSDLVLSGFLRIVTHPRILERPLSAAAALDIAQERRAHPRCTSVNPGVRHWNIFTSLCRQVQATGNTVPNAYLAALAIESGSEFATADRGFARFPGLRWRHPLDAQA